MLQGAIGGAAGGRAPGRPARRDRGAGSAGRPDRDDAGVGPGRVRLEEIDMTNNPNELTIENSALVLIDHQPAVALSVALLAPRMRLSRRAASPHFRNLVWKSVAKSDGSIVALILVAMPFVQLPPANTQSKHTQRFDGQKPKRAWLAGPFPPVGLFAAISTLRQPRHLTLRFRGRW